MSDTCITLIPLQSADRPQFIRDLQTAFEIAVLEEYGPQEEEIVPAGEIEASLDAPGAEAFRVVSGGQIIGGVVVSIHPQTQRNSLDLFFLNPECHSKGLGLAVWQAIEEQYPKTRTWETITPYFERRNIHFYVNKCGFHIVEFFNPHHPDPHHPGSDLVGRDYYFRFEKDMPAPSA